MIRTTKTHKLRSFKEFKLQKVFSFLLRTTSLKEKCFLSSKFELYCATVDIDVPKTDDLNIISRLNLNSFKQCTTEKRPFQSNNWWLFPWNQSRERCGSPCKHMINNSSWEHQLNVWNKCIQGHYERTRWIKTPSPDVYFDALSTWRICLSARLH